MRMSVEVAWGRARDSNLFTEVRLRLRRSMVAMTIVTVPSSSSRTEMLRFTSRLLTLIISRHPRAFSKCWRVDLSIELLDGRPLA